MTVSPLFSWRRAVGRSNLTPMQRHVAAVLSFHMNERGGSCFPSIATLVVETGCARSTVKAAVQTLRDRGWLTVTRGGNDVSFRRANEYQATIPKGPTVGPLPDEEGADTRPPRGRPSAPSTSCSSSLSTTSLHSASPNAGPLNQNDDGGNRNPLRAALANIGLPSPPAGRELGGFNTAVKELRDAGVTAAEIDGLAATYRRKWPDMTLSVFALAANLSVLRAGHPRSGDAEQRARAEAAAARGDPETFDPPPLVRRL